MNPRVLNALPIGAGCSDPKVGIATVPAFGTRQRWRHIVLRLCSVVLSAIAAVAQPQLRATEAEDSVTLEIPAQPLEDALMAYAAATGVQVFADHALLAGRRSSPVQGVYDIATGLRLMLTGTGLDTRRAAPRSYTLIATSVPEPFADQLPAWSTEAPQGKFFAALQTAIKRTLCARPETIPGRYRAALAMWIGRGGRIADVRLLSDRARVPADRILVDSLRGTSVGQSPPADLPQPVTFVILPRPPDRTGDCPPGQ